MWKWGTRFWKLRKDYAYYKTANTLSGINSSSNTLCKAEVKSFEWIYSERNSMQNIWCMVWFFVADQSKKKSQKVEMNSRITHNQTVRIRLGKSLYCPCVELINILEGKFQVCVCKYYIESSETKKLLSYNIT